MDNNSSLGQIFPIALQGLDFRGSDARSFLHQQVTSDIANLAASSAQYSAWCTPKGRVLSTFLLFQSASDTITMILPSDQREYVLTNLSRYIMRSKVKVADQAAQYQLFGIIANDGVNPHTVGDLVIKISSNSTAENQVNQAIFAALSIRQNEDLLIICLDQQRLLIMIKSEQAENILAKLQVSLQYAPQHAYAKWQIADIEQGVAWIAAQNRQDFVPQMLNLQEIGALSFTKGCYPGQEIVARSQYIGRVKRHLQRFTGEEMLPEASELFNSGDLATAVGKTISQVDCRNYPDLQKKYGCSIGQAVISEAAVSPLVSKDGRLVHILSELAA